MSDLIELNVTGRLLVLLKRHARFDNRCLQIYQRAVSDVVRTRLESGADVADMNPLIDGQIALLEDALLRRERPRAAAEAATDGDAAAADEADADASTTAAEKPREARQFSGYVPPLKNMAEKLQDARKPLQTLLREDCVHAGLITAKQAEKLILGMTGKTSEQSEQDVVEQLRQILQDQVKSFIRKAKGGPWADPRTQEDLRQDIHAARTVRSILMLARQVIKEYQTWQKEHHRGGILGLFSPRRRIVDRQ